MHRIVFNLLILILLQKNVIQSNKMVYFGLSAKHSITIFVILEIKGCQKTTIKNYRYLQVK